MRYIQYICEKLLSSNAKIRANPALLRILNRLLDISEVPAKYEYMKNELLEFFDKDTVDNEEIKFFRQFADKY